MVGENSYTDREGNEHKGYAKAPLDSLETEYDNPDKGALTEGMEHGMHRKQVLLERNKGLAVYDLTNRNESLEFVQKVASGRIAQFKHNKEQFERRYYVMADSIVFKFKDDLIQLWCERTKTQIGNRKMPKRNMFIETCIDFDGVVITGIHLVKTAIMPDGTQVYDLDPQRKIRGVEYGINMFFTGYDKDGGQFFSQNLIDSEMTDKYYDYEGKRKKSSYGCPHCHMPMRRLTKGEWFCDYQKCIDRNQGKNIYVYDTGYVAVQKKLKHMQMKNIWKVEDKLRRFVCAMLDYYMFKEVVLVDGLTRQEAQQKNIKRRKKGKPPLAPIKLMKARGRLEKRLFRAKRIYGSYEVARQAHMVEASWVRCYNKDHYSRLYSFLAKCKTAEQKEKVLMNIEREDEEGFPEKEVYKWDEERDVICYFRDEHQRGGNPKDDRTTLKVVD